METQEVIKKYLHSLANEVCGCKCREGVLMLNGFNIMETIDYDGDNIIIFFSNGTMIHGGELGKLDLSDEAEIRAALAKAKTAIDILNCRK